ncbi:GMP/IMP nucleotidase [Marinobacter caseinilyticus]|uniref:GMP/IMP nucleotidase n=1 Tax=Marinobacter caseinilyticus TaxID=2692195 RepID=UPI00140886B4|nr:GMP/IMP nucleotidase [Marinobacter caseinilyticus]
MVNWHSLDTVFLDMDGTLLDLHYDTHFWLEHLPKRYAEHFGLTQAQARDKIVPMIQAERGSLNWYCTDYWSRHLALDIAALKTEVKEKIAYRPHVQAFLTEVRAAGLRSVIVTNCHPDPLALKLARTGLDQLVDRVISSHRFGKPKEAPDFWSDLHQIEPFDPARTLMIDDSFPVLDSAVSAGISQCLAILAPDSQMEPHQPHPDLPSIHHFNEVIPLRGNLQCHPALKRL